MKSDCSKHIVPEYLSDLKKVAEDICDMPYDKVIEFLEHAERKLIRDANNDRKGGRLKLWILLTNSAFRIRETTREFEKVWEVCKKHMK